VVVELVIQEEQEIVLQLVQHKEIQVDQEQELLFLELVVVEEQQQQVQMVYHVRALPLFQMVELVEQGLQQRFQDQQL
jgi:hypothetical protein